MQSFIFIRHEGKHLRVDLQDIQYIEARKNYTRLVMEGRPTILVLLTLKHWEQVLPRESFCRIHRGYIVAIGKILSFDTRYACLAGGKLSIGEQYRRALPERVTILANEPNRKEVFQGISI